MVRYARLTFSHDNAVINPVVSGELDGRVTGSIAVDMGGWSVGWMRGRTAGVEDCGEFISTCRGE